MVKIMTPKSFKYIENYDYILPEYGFKIHISGTLQNYEEIFSTVLPFLTSNKIAAKYLKDQESVLDNLSDMEQPAESGKLITIYPKDKEHCLYLLDTLYELLPNNLEGVYILSDRNYKKSNVLFYRYGLIQPKNKKTIDSIPTLVGPNGEQWEDFQKCYFDLPSWVDDLQETQILTSSYLSENYVVDSVLKQSNGGNVYKAIHLNSNKYVVIKECRQHIICTFETNKKQFRENEWNLSSLVEDYAPSKNEKIKEWVNDYYVYEYIHGQSLLNFCDKLNLFSYETERYEQNINKFNKLLLCFSKILETVRYFHSKNIVLNDIHSDNFIINDKENVVFIDLENSYIGGSTPLVGVYSDIALREWNDVDGFIADCHKVGNLFLYLLGRLQIKDHTILTAELKNLLLQKGIESNIGRLINYLLSEDANIEKASDIMRKEVYAHTSKLNYKLNLESIDSEQWNKEIIKIVSLQETLIKKYRSILEHPKNILVKLKSEVNLGLDGVAGVLLYLSSISYDKDVIEEGIDYVLSNMVKDSNGHKGIQINEYSISPYLSNGTAGIIHLLMYVDPVKYNPAILELANALTFEFAQFSGIWNGMLGISITLLQLFKLTKNKVYLKKAQELFISCKILSQRNMKLRKELLYVTHNI